MTIITNSVKDQLTDLLSEISTQVIERERSAFDLLTNPYGDRIILFGAGQLGQKTLNGLRQIGIEPLAFVDNNPKLWNESIDNLIVLSPEDAANQYRDNSAFIVTIWRANSSHRQAQTTKQLSDLGCQKIISVAYLFWKYPGIFLPHYFLDLPHKLYEQIDLVKSASLVWADSQSQQEYIDRLRWILHLDFDGLSSPVQHTQYFPNDLFSLSDREVFIDCGAYDGDTINTLLRKQKSNFDRIIAFEPDPDNYRNLHNYVEQLSPELKAKIVLHKLATSDCKEQLRFSAMGTASSVLSNDGTLIVEAVTLDEVLVDTSPTFIKMDIEGGELAALEGGRKTITTSLPILAISTYHCQDHLWRIPLLIRSFSSEYRLFLRPHGEECWDGVCYAVPVNRLNSKYILN
jgi:FkbM family methyltransferase